MSEPEGGDPVTVRLTVRRLGGTVGVVEAGWNISSSDGRLVLFHHEGIGGKGGDSFIQCGISRGFHNA